MLVLNGREVAALADMRMAVRTVGEALAEFSRGRATVPERVPIAIPTHAATALFMPAYAGGLGALGLKVVSVYPHNPARGRPTITGVYVLLDESSGETLAVMEASTLTAIRTGAVTGQATDLLARPDARSLAIIGTGVQAREALRAVLAVRPLTEVRLFNRTPARARAFADEVRQWPEGRGLRITVAPDAGAAVRQADIVITATTSGTPVFPAEAVAPGMHINAIGVFKPHLREVPGEVVAAAAKVVVESRHSAMIEAGDLLIPMKEGQFSPESIHAELGEVFAGVRPGRERAEEVTLFKSVGQAIMDLALARVIYERALERGLGTKVDLT